jgi:hypothetical protein
VLERDLMLDADALAFVTHSRRLRRPGILGRLTGTGDPDVSHLTGACGRRAPAETSGTGRGPLAVSRW